MATPRSGLPEVWPSGLVGLIEGSDSCWFKAWFKAHYVKYRKAASTFDFAKWRVEHTALIQHTVARLTREGWHCSLEGQNRFKLVGKMAVVVGKPDIIARKSGMVKVVDCKGGAQYDKHTVQVALYMVCLPLVWDRKNLVLSGEVVYQDDVVTVSAEQAGLLRSKIFDGVTAAAAVVPPEPVPSQTECKYCDVLECKVRVDSEAPSENTASTELF